MEEQKELMTHLLFLSIKMAAMTQRETTDRYQWPPQNNRELKGRVSRLCAWANCHVSPFNSIVIETIESTDAGNGNNPIVMDYSLELLL